MIGFKNIKYFNCSLDFNLTHLLTVVVMLSSNAFFGGGDFFFIVCLTTSMLKVPPNMLPENMDFNHHEYFW